MILVFLVMISNVALADDVAVPMELEGRAGMWVELEEFRHLTTLEANNQDQQARIRNLEERLELNIRKATYLEQAHDLAVEDRQRVRDYAARLEERLDDPLRSPVVWLAGGVVIGAFTVILSR